jgi:DNA methylase
MPTETKLPARVTQAPTTAIAFLDELSKSVAKVTEIPELKKRMALIDAVRAYANHYGEEAEPVKRQAAAAWVLHMIRLGELLAELNIRPGRRLDITNVVADDNSPLLREMGVSRDLASAAGTMKKAKKWAVGVAKAIGTGARKRFAKTEIVLEARRMVASEEAEGPKARPKPGAAPLPGGDGPLFLGDFTEIGHRVADNSVALVLTDPPYDRDSLHLYGAAADFAARVLLPGGSLIAYAPNYALPEAFENMTGTLRYWWTLALLYERPASLMVEFGIQVCYKPLLWFVKGGRHDKQRIVKDVISGIAGARQKTEHEWQQSVDAATALITLLTDKKDLVCDPMAGAATTLVAALASGRRAVGFEIKPETHRLALRRMAER